MDKQKGCCAICGESLYDPVKLSKTTLHVDHDHQTGKIRGLLCTTCNTGLGHFKDSSLLLTKAINYIKEN